MGLDSVRQQLPAELAEPVPEETPLCRGSRQGPHHHAPSKDTLDPHTTPCSVFLIQPT